MFSRYKFTAKIVCVILVILSIMLYGCDAGKKVKPKTGSMSANITLWAYEVDAENTLNEAFNRQYPNIKIEVIPVPWADYENKLMTAIAARSDIPDIAVSESYWWGKWLKTKDVFDDLKQYGIDPANISDIADNVIYGQDGNLIVAPISYGISCLWYEKGLAKKYLGTDSPQDMQNQLHSWQDYLNLGEHIKQASGGKDFLFADTASLMEFLIASDSGYTTGNTINLTEKIEPKVQLIQTMLDKGYVAKYNGVEIDDSYREGNILFYPSADWLGQYIESQDPSEKNKWGVISPPGGTFFRGGYGYVIPKDSNPANKKAAAKRINYVLTPAGSSEVINLNMFSAYKYAYNNQVLGKFNVYFNSYLTRTFYDWVDSPGKKQARLNYTVYDDIIGKSTRKEAYNMMVSNLSTQQVLDNIEKDIHDELGNNITIK
jgi:multiple sugar transport system substrate-binding protein